MLLSFFFFFYHRLLCPKVACYSLSLHLFFSTSSSVMDAPQCPQGIGAVRRVDETESSRTSSEKIKKARREKEEAAAALKCPRCNSSNTKFCYYNNYSLSQPRYFCKSCRRYWTAGGTLRNVPVGGTSRKRNKRSSSNSYLSISTQKPIPDLSPPPQNPKIHQGRDLNIPYNDPLLYNGISDELVALPFTLGAQNPSFDLFKTGGFSSLVSGPVSDSNSAISSGFQLAENRFGNLQAAVQDDSSRIIFPSEQVNYEFEHDRGMQRDSNGFWSGMMLSGGSW